jgi:hypothetical protein
MDGLVRTIGNGVAGLVVTAFEVIGGTLRSIVNTASSALPGLALPVVAFGILVLVAWTFAKR